MTATIQIPIAGYKSIYSVADVDRAMEDSSASKNDSLKSLYEKMIRSGGMRYIIKPSSTEGIDSLYESSPNFTEVIDNFKKHMSLAISGNEPMQITPILLLGEPGLGKTYFAKSVAKILGTGFEFISMSSLTAGWVLSGASSQWTNAKPGKVAQSLVNGEYANPLITLDEVDKAGGDSRYDPMGALYSLLEQDTAKHFKDEFIEVSVDASHILWIATANDESSIPEPILNRMNVYTIERPDYEGSLKIALAVYQDILNDHNWGFPTEPAQNVLEKLASIAPRDMRKLLIDAFGNAKLANRDKLQPEDLHTEKLGKGKNRIGF
ncbi:AAA family ATPase [Sulfurirhabdus autotrophica]|uniref:ATP-dependent Lon protease n=1 Tax=Sulfurirhabdus autotrophica TaxID=1706046 RepID=A0A4R3YFF4_9PROT|nr:AAA family ATPase [Sulfurirhabdus autotrophica]TCV90652.1 ATP-dependent Lon protease [Sulfurirhabdus autotrophica]